MTRLRIMILLSSILLLIVFLGSGSAAGVECPEGEEITYEGTESEETICLEEALSLDGETTERYWIDSADSDSLYINTFDVEPTAIDADDHRRHLPTDTSTLSAIDQDEHDIHWEQTLEGIYRTAIEDDGMLYVGTSSGHFYALDAESGSIEWETELEEELPDDSGGWYLNPELVDETLAIDVHRDRESQTNRGTYLVDASSGDVLEDRETLKEIEQTPTGVLVRTEDTVYSMDGHTHEIQWTSEEAPPYVERQSISVHDAGYGDRSPPGLDERYRVYQDLESVVILDTETGDTHVDEIEDPYLLGMQSAYTDGYVHLVFNRDAANTRYDIADMTTDGLTSVPYATEEAFLYSYSLETGERVEEFETPYVSQLHGGGETLSITEETEDGEDVVNVYDTFPSNELWEVDVEENNAVELVYPNGDLLLFDHDRDSDDPRDLRRVDGTTGSTLWEYQGDEYEQLDKDGYENDLLIAHEDSIKLVDANSGTILDEKSDAFDGEPIERSRILQVEESPVTDIHFELEATEEDRTRVVGIEDGELIGGSEGTDIEGPTYVVGQGDNDELFAVSRYSSLEIWDTDLTRITEHDGEFYDSGETYLFDTSNEDAVFYRPLTPDDLSEPDIVGIDEPLNLYDSSSEGPEILVDEHHTEVETFSWEVFDGDEAIDEGEGERITASQVEPGEYEVELTVEDNQGNVVQERTDLAVFKQPSLALSYDEDVPDDLPLEITVEAEGTPDKTELVVEPDGPDGLDSDWFDIERVTEDDSSFEAVVESSEPLEEVAEVDDTITLSFQLEHETGEKSDVETAELTVTQGLQEVEVDDDDDDTDDDADDDGPGFGIGGAIIGIAGAGYLLQRRLDSSAQD